MRRAAVVLLLLTLVWGGAAALGLSVYWDHDLRHHHLPWRAWSAAEWLAGRPPLWAPGVANGFPLLADGQTGALYPPGMLLFVLLPAELALNATLLLHLWWAGLGTWLLARVQGRSAGAALLAAVVFGFSGFLATHALYLGMLCVVAWLPWLLTAVHRRRAGAAGVCAAMMLVAGHPQAAAFGLLLAGAYALHRAWVERQARGLVPLALGMLLALLAASAQVMATLELTGASMRHGGVDALFADIGALPPQELLNGVLPSLFGFERPADITETYHHRGPGYWGAGVNHWEMSFYLGIPAVLLALLGLRDRQQRFWGGAALLALLLMLGGRTPLWPLLRHLPLFDGFRFPVRFSLALSLAVALLAAAGLDRLVAMTGAAQAALARRVAALALLVVVGASLAGLGLRAVEAPLRGRLEARFLGQVDLPPLPALPPLAAVALPALEAEDPAGINLKVERIVQSLRRSTDPGDARVYGPAGLLLLVALLIAAHQRRLLDSRGLALLLALLCYADLYSFGADYQGTHPRAAVVRTPPVLAVAGPDLADYRLTVVDRRQDPALDLDLLSASLGLPFGVRDVILTSPLLMVRNEALLAVAGLDVGDKGPQKWERLRQHRDLLDLLGVRWLLSVHGPAVVGDARVQQVAAPGLDPRVHLYRNDGALPAAWLVGCVAAVPADQPDSGDQAYARLLAIDPRNTAVVEGDDPLPACDPSPAGAVEVVAQAPGLLRLRVSATRPALLVNRESWYPGWEAEIDGQPATLLRTDLIFRGVAVPTGDSDVVLAYRARPLRRLLWLGLAASLALVAWTVAERRAGRASPRTAA